MTHDFATKFSIWFSSHLFVSVCDRVFTCEPYHASTAKTPSPSLVSLSLQCYLWAQLTIPYHPLPMDSALLTGQHGDCKATCGKWKNGRHWERNIIDGWWSCIWCIFRCWKWCYLQLPIITVYSLLDWQLYNFYLLLCQRVEMPLRKMSVMLLCTVSLFSTCPDATDTHYLFSDACLYWCPLTNPWTPLDPLSVAVRLCGEPVSALTEHIMTGIPSCAGLDVIRNTR